ncbi:MAG: Ig-like domain-containing protein [Treponema sp.]|nr:Ig-like domain-containing protein [Treponema sp.]
MRKNLGNTGYDAAESGKLSLPPQVDGGAFRSADGTYIYVLWAKTTVDMDETASAQYSFPPETGVSYMAVTAWDGTETTIDGNTVPLTGTPVLVRINVRAADIIHVQSITIDPPALLPVYEGSTRQFTASILPENAKIQTVTWSSDDPSIAAIDNIGRFTAIKTGTTFIRAISGDGNIGAACPVEVIKEPIRLSYILIEPGWVSLEVSETQQMNITIVPAETTNKQITWSSANEQVAKVSQDGLVKAIGKGETRITAIPSDDPSRAKTATVRVE